MGENLREKTRFSSFGSTESAEKIWINSFSLRLRALRVKPLPIG